MEGALAPLLVSTGVVAVAEIGDKTQLLALVLAARFRRPWPIVLGILVATLANHAVAGLAGAWFAHLLHGPWLRWIIAGSFVAVGAWALVPDKFEDDDKLYIPPPVMTREHRLTNPFMDVMNAT
jgi:putative Ca2+/H+ antiporter (TMEM165/GDT1 family)